MDSSKTYKKDNIPPKLLMANGDICSIIITPDLNRCIANGTFPINLKYADITPIFKKNVRLLKINYRPVSILPTVSKIYEKILYVQIYEYFNKIFCKYLCGFRKGHSTQHCLLFMLDKLNKALDKGLYTGILLTDLSKAFDSISHDLLIAKLSSYGFSKNSLNLMNDYLNDRKQRTKIGDNFSSYREIVYGVPQGSILGPLLFNIYINDLFLFSKDFNLANYADDCSPFELSGTIDEVIKKLENNSCILIKWYDSNYLKPNPEKWHLVLSDTNENMVINIANDKIANSSYEKILGIHFDNKLNFNTHVTKLCERAGQKLHALARISNFMSLKKKKLLMNAFITSQYNYCALLWMCHSRALNTRKNKIHERALRIVYNDDFSPFQDLLEKSGTVSIHHRNLQLLAIEIFKTLHDLSPSFLSEIFKPSNTKYDLRNSNTLVSKNINTTNSGLETVFYLAPRIWEQIPEEIKQSKSLNSFKKKINLWIPNACTCRLCKTYVPNVGFLQMQ